MLERDAAILEHRPDPHGELLRASPTAPEKPQVARPVPAAHLVHVRIPAARAGGVVAPPLAFHKLHGDQLVGTRFWERPHHVRFVLCDLAHSALARCVKYKDIWAVSQGLLFPFPLPFGWHAFNERSQGREIPMFIDI